MKSVQALPSLQAGRAFAAIAVVSFHASKLMQLPKYGGIHLLDSWFISGGLGVDFFFVLSGFIIVHAHAKDVGNPAALSRYVWRRFSRIYPIYWICLATVVAVLLFMGKSFPITELLRNFFLISQTDNPPLISQAWTLFHEVLFYAVFALLIVNRRAGVFLIAAWAVLCVLCPPAQDGVIFQRINLEFLFGMISWAIFRRSDARYFWWPLACGGFMFLAILWSDHVRLEPGPDLILIAGAASGFMVLGLAMADKAAWAKIPNVLVYLGAASYSIYLTHFVTLSVLAKASARFVPSMPPAIALMCLIAGSIGAGCALHAFVEQPLLSRLRHK